MLSNETLASFFETNAQLINIHHYSLSDLEAMIPFEREIYISLLITHLKREKEEMERASRRK